MMGFSALVAALAASSLNCVSSFPALPMRIHHNAIRNEPISSPAFTMRIKTTLGSNEGENDYMECSNERGISMSQPSPPEADGIITKRFMLISDSTGVTVKTALSKSLSQFEWSDDECFVTDSGHYCKIKKRSFTFVRSEEAVATILKTAKAREAMVAFTFADPSLRAKTVRMCELSNIPSVDLMGPMLDCMSTFLQQVPAGKPRTERISLNDSYYNRIEAVEFTLKADDGQAPWLLKDADVIIVGVSRTGKTPLSVVLSQLMGWKVANIPLVLEVPPPKELLDAENIDPKRVFCLTIKPSELKRIRTTRLERRKVTSTENQMASGGGGRAPVTLPKSNYADRNYLLKDLKKARDLCQDQGWTQIDVTGRAVEETASFISELINERFDEDKM